MMIKVNDILVIVDDNGVFLDLYEVCSVLINHDHFNQIELKSVLHNDMPLIVPELMVETMVKNGCLWHYVNNTEHN